MTNQIIKRLHRPFTLFIICILIIAFFILTNINKKTAPSGNEQYNHSFVFGGTENDYGFGISVINDDYLIIAGHTSSTNFNQINNLKRIGTIGKSNIFIALISQKKQAITKMIIIGGEDNDFLKNISISQDGYLYLTGSTFSKDFPAKTKYGKPSMDDKTNVFVVRIHAMLDGPATSVILGGDGFDYPGAIISRGDGVYIGGNTSSVNFPVTPDAPNSSFNNTEPEQYSYGFDAFLTKLSPDLSNIMASTYLGGDADEFIYDMKITENSQVIIAGTTHSPNFPKSQNSYTSTSSSHGVMAFITSFTPDLSQISKSMVLDTTNHLYVKAMAIDPDNSIWLTGYCTNGDLPITVNTAGKKYGGGGYDSFVINFADDLSTILSASYLGGNNNEFAQSIVISPQGKVIIGGFTDSFDTFPCTSNTNESLFNFGHYDTFTTELSHDLSTIDRSILRGGSGYDYIYRMTLFDNKIYFCGNTTSDNLKALQLNKTKNLDKKNDIYLQSLELIDQNTTSNINQNK